jgi:hypothetical protein
MAKIVLGKRPADFKKKVEIPVVSGEVSEVEFLFKYRTRKEYAKLMDDHAKGVRERSSVDQSSGDFSFERFVGQSIEDDADLILTLAAGWDLDDALTKESIVSMLDTYGASGPLVVTAYRTAINEGRLGN